MIPWKEVENNPQYQALPLAEQQKAKAQYFNDVVAPKIPQEDLEIARTQFFGETAPTIPAMTAFPKVSPSEKKVSLKKGALWAGEQVLGAGETALSLATGMLAWPISKVAGAAKMVTSGAEEARKTEAQLAEYLTWKPYTEAGRGAVQLVGKSFEKLMWPAKKAGEIVEKTTGSKELGYATEFGAELLTLKGLHAAGAKAKAKLKKPIPGEPGYRTVKGELEKARKIELVEKLKEAKPEKPLAGLKKAEMKLRTKAKDIEKLETKLSEQAEILARKKQLPPGQGFILKEKSMYSPELARKLRTVTEKKALPPSYRGFILKEKAAYSPELAQRLKAIKERKALPKGQEFILKPKVKLHKGPEYYPRGAQWVAGKETKAIVEYKPILNTRNLPYRSAQAAHAGIRQRGFDPKEYGIVEIKNGWAIQRKAKTLEETKQAKIEKLKRLPKGEQPSPSTQTLDFLGLQSAYEKALQKIRGIGKPKLVRPAEVKPGKVRLVEKPKELKPGESLKSHIEKLDEPLSGKGLKEKAIRVREGIAEEALSPETVYRRDPDAGSKIYRIFDLTETEKNKFLSPEIDKFIKASGKIKKESVSALQVGRALDAKISRSELKPQEAKLYDFLKDRYDFLIRFYARSRAGSEAAYKEVVKWVNQPYRPVARIESLSEYKQLRYNAMRKRLAEVRGGKKKTELRGTKAKQYKQIRNNMRDMLHKEWLEKLPEGQREAYTALSRRIKDYFTHIFDNEQLLADLKSEATILNKKLKTATNPSAITRYKKRLKKVEESITSLEGGKLITYEGLPKNIRFKYFEPRKGKEGYSFDAIKAYESYLHGIARKIFDEPAIRMAAELHKSLDPSLKGYNKRFIRSYMGWDRHKLDPLSGAIASAQWMRTLGFNPRSAIVNFTQRLNTIVEVGGKYSLKGERFGFTKKGKELFDQTGLAREVPQVLMEGSVPAGMERIRVITGYLFNKMELGNRKHAFLSGYLKAKDMGMSEKAAIQYGIDVVHKTQFRYGKVGMPMFLRRPIGRLVGQFSSYTIKQIELMATWIKNEPAKAIKFIAYAEGINYTLKEFLDTDLSNALGFGITWGEVMNALKDMSEADWRGFWRHLRLSVSGGGGILPSGLGPTATGALKVAEAITKGKGLEQLKKELTPVQVKRFVDAYKSVVGERKGLYPVYDRRGRVMYYLTGPELVQRTVGPRTAKESKEWLKYKKKAELEQEYNEILQDIKDATVEGDTKKAKALIKKYKIVPTLDSIVTEKLRRKHPREKVELFRRKGRIGKREEYQYLREGEILR